MKTFIASGLLVLSAVSPSMQIGNYNATCGVVTLENRIQHPQYLAGVCDGPDGTQVRSRLDLNLCYSPNGGGMMVPTNKGIGLNTSMSIFKPCEYCFIGNGYELPPEYYACDCYSPDDYGTKHSGIWLSDLISNENGFLTCFDNIGVQLDL